MPLMNMPSCLFLSLPPETLLLIANYLNRRGWACLARTCWAMNSLLYTELDLYFEGNNYRPMLWEARHNRPYTLERGLLIRAADPDSDPEDWRNVQAILLNQAISNEPRAAVRVLLENHVDPNGMVRNSSVAPLTAAVRNGNISIVRMLLEAGANVNCRPGAVGGWTVAAQACWNGSEEMVDLLLRYGAEVPNDYDTYLSCTDEDHRSDSSAEGDAS